MFLTGQISKMNIGAQVLSLNHCTLILMPQSKQNQGGLKYSSSIKWWCQRNKLTLKSQISRCFITWHWHLQMDLTQAATWLVQSAIYKVMDLQMFMNWIPKCFWKERKSLSSMRLYGSLNLIDMSKFFTLTKTTLYYTNVWKVLTSSIQN